MGDSHGFIPPVPSAAPPAPKPEATAVPVIEQPASVTQPENHRLPHVHSVNTALPDLIELRGIRQVYPGKRRGDPEAIVIDDLDLLVEDVPNRGQFAVVLGPSGCGKSTLLRYIAGLQKPTKGEVLLRGRPIQRGQSVSMVFQQYSSLPWYSVLQNVELGLRFRNVPPKERRDRAMEMIKKVGLAGHEHKYAKYGTLSGGQLQRVAIARALVASPDMVLMDEPFGALDSQTRHKMQLLISEIWESREMTVVFVTHDIEEAVFLGDDIYVMDTNPASIVKRLRVELPLHRDRDTKRTPEFHKIVDEIEDFMQQVERTSLSQKQ